MKKRDVFITLLSMMLIQSALAHHPKVKCPSVVAIKTVGVDSVVINKEEGPGYWLAGTVNKPFDTDKSWTFAMSVEGKDANEALFHANINLSKLALVDSCTHSGKTYCYYQSYYQNEECNALAVTPACSLNDI